MLVLPVVSIVVLGTVYFQSLVPRILLGFILFCKILAYLRSSGLELRYSKHNELFQEFVEQTKIAKMSFEPYLFGPTAMSQGVFYIISEAVHKFFINDIFEREMLVLPDGGTIAIDWDGSIPDPSKKPEKPILVVCPGLGGDSKNLYSLALLKQARKKFKVATILYRGA